MDVGFVPSALRLMVDFYQCSETSIPAHMRETVTSQDQDRLLWDRDPRPKSGLETTLLINVCTLKLYVLVFLAD